MESEYIMENTEKNINKITETLTKELESLSNEGLHEFFIFFYRMNHQYGNMIAVDKFEEFLESFDSNPFKLNEDKAFKVLSSAFAAPCLHHALRTAAGKCPRSR